MYEIPQQLLSLATWQLSDKNGNSGQTKEAFIPSGAGGMDAAGMPPEAAAGMASPMAPAAPVDPAAMGMMPGMDMGMGMPGAPMPELPMPAPAPLPSEATPPTTSTGGGSKKIDPAMIYTEMINIRKMLSLMFQNLGWELPPDVLNSGEIGRAMASGESLPPPPSAPSDVLMPGGEKQGVADSNKRYMGAPYPPFTSCTTVVSGLDALAAVCRSMTEGNKK